LTTRLETELPAVALSLLAIPTLTWGEILLLVQEAIIRADSIWTVIELIVTRLLGSVRAQQLATI